MKNLKVFLLAVLLCALVLESYGGYFYVSKNHNLKGVCTYTGYKPGGGKPNIKPITAPTATMPAGAIAKIAGLGGKSTALAMHSVNLIKAFQTGGKMFLSIAPKLAPALGVFGAALGFVTAMTKPTPQDILDQANKAIAELTKEVNDRLTKMEGYVDFKVINMEKDLINREYRTLFNLFGNCIKDPTKSEVDKCMRDAEKAASAASPKFLILDTSVNTLNPIPQRSRDYYTKNPSKAPSYYDTKRIEAGIISFRDYANLHLLIVSTLVNTYKGDKQYYGRYLKDQRDAANLYAKYGEWAYNWILSRNVLENKNNQFKRSCSNPAAIKEGWFVAVYTQAKTSCKIECTAMNKPAECSYGVGVRADGKKPSEYYKQYIPACGNCYKAAATSLGITKSRSICDTFLSGLEKDIKTYYDGELMSNVRIWKEVAVKAANDLNALPKREQPEEDFNEEYSEDFEVRLKHANKLAIQQYKDMIRKQVRDYKKENIYLMKKRNERIARKREEEMESFEDFQDDNDEIDDEEKGYQEKHVLK